MMAAMTENPLTPPSAVAPLLDGKKAVVVGVLNRASIATAIAEKLAAHGAQVVLTYQNERARRGVERVAESIGGAALLPLDVTDDAQCASSITEAAELLGGIDVLVHSVAFARTEDLTGRFSQTSREGFALAHDISAYSLLALSALCEPFMAARGGGSVMTLSYIGGERATERYGVMGAAKASLESVVRYLAVDLGPSGVRVNAISAGPIRTAAARAIKGLDGMIDRIESGLPLRRNITAAEVAGSAVFLASSLSAGVTGETLHVDAGFHAIGDLG